MALRKIQQKKALLALEDGTVFSGWSFGAEGEKEGEVVFNTSLTGYQEILTDPSYKGQIVTMTYPLIGNYGVNEKDIESAVPQVEGFVVRENYKQELDRYLKKHKIVGIEGIDTRMLTRRLRVNGSLKGIISTRESNVKKLVQKAKAAKGVEGVDLVKVVTCKKPYRFNKKGKYKVAVYDYGVKLNILRNLENAGCSVTVYPADYPAEKLLAAKPDGILLSNGPADPAAVTYAIENIKKLIASPAGRQGKLPIFGICLGNQLLGLALGGKTYKLKFGHHGGNQPVMDLKTGKVEITAQNHGFAVDMATLPKDEIELTHVNLNDRTVEGMAHKKFPIFSVQYHPEAGPGPHDAVHLFKRFTEMMEDAKKN